MLEFVHADVIQFLKSCSDNSFQFIHADPPYNTTIHKRRDGKYKIIKTGWEFQSEDWYKTWLHEAYRVLGSDGSMVIWANYKTLPIITRFIEPKGIFVWCKPNPVPVFSSRVPGFGVEFMIWTAKGKWIYNKHDYIKRYNSRFKSYIELGARVHKSNHPCEKPKEILERLLVLFTNSTTRVLDLFSGSASLAAVCKQMNIDYVGVDNNLQWIEYSKSLYLD